MIDYSLGCILANVPVSYDEFKMKSYLPRNYPSPITWRI